MRVHLTRLPVLLSAAAVMCYGSDVMCHDDAACDLFGYRSGQCHLCNCCPRCWYVAQHPSCGLQRVGT